MARMTTDPPSEPRPTGFNWDGKTVKEGQRWKLLLSIKPNPNVTVWSRRPLHKPGCSNALLEY